MSSAAGAQLFAHLDTLVASGPVTVERPRGTAHPRIPAAIYPVDYGEVGDTTAGDGACLDVFVGSATGSGVVAVALTCDPGKRDVEVKVLLDCTDAEMDAVAAFLTDTLGIGGLLVPRSRSERADTPATR